MREKFEYFLAVTLIKFAKILPISLVYGIFDFCGVFLFHALKSRRKLAIHNIQKALKIGEDEAYNLAKENFKSIAKTLAQTLLFSQNRLNFDDLMINGEESLEKIKRLKGDNKNGVIFFTAHFGNWEILAHYFGSNGHPCSVVGRRGNNSLIEERITRPFRTMMGNDLIYKDDAMIKMVRVLKKGGNVGILTDQKTNSSYSFRTTFFGRECYTTRSLSALYLKFLPSLIPIFAKRVGEKYEFVIKEFPEIPKNLNDEEKEFFITQTCNDIFEEVVRSAPEQWFWMHNRWKID